ncbi:MAG: hypothetical protein RLZ45_2746 [Verrucomicrobiota bacterium]
MKPSPPPEVPGSDPGAVVPEERGGRFLQRCWRGFKWGVRLAYLPAAILLYLAVHLHQVGLPGFVREPLVAQLEAQGLRLEYSRIHLEWGEGLFAENVLVHFRGRPDSQFAYFQKIQLRINLLALRDPELPIVESLGLVGGEVSLPVEGGADESAALLKLNHISGDLEFEGFDTWRLVGLFARIHTLTFEAMGSLRATSHLFANRSPRPRDGATPVLSVRSGPLARILNELEATGFRTPPKLDLAFAIDGERLERSLVEFRMEAAGATNAIGTFDGLRLRLSVSPDTEEPPTLRGVFRLDSDAVRTSMGSVAGLGWQMGFQVLANEARPSHLDWQLTGSSLERDGFNIGRIRAQGVTLSTNRFPEVSAGEGVRAMARSGLDLSGGYFSTVELGFHDLQAPWGAVTNASVLARIWNATNDWSPRGLDLAMESGGMRVQGHEAAGLMLRGSVLPALTNTGPALSGFWTDLAPWRLRLEAGLDHPKLSTGTRLDSLGALVDWADGRASLTNLEARFEEGTVVATATVDARSRETRAILRAEAQLRGLAAVLPDDLWQVWTRNDIGTNSRVQLTVSASGRLPEWTVPMREWREPLRREISLEGGVEAAPVSWSGVTLDEVGLKASWRRERLRLDSLHIAQGCGRVEVDGTCDWTAGDFEARVSSTLDPLVFRPIIRAPGLARQFDMIRLGSRPEILAEVRGNTHSMADLTGTARVAITNAVYRLEPVTELRTTVQYTNGNVFFTGTDLLQSTNRILAPWMRFDPKANLLWFTNATARVDLASLARVIGPRTADTLGPYHFPVPPEVEVNGVIPTADEADADVVFKTRAPAFEWWYFKFTNLVATVGWKGDRLSITNVTSGFYGGSLETDIQLDLTEARNTRFTADPRFRDVRVDLLMEDLVTRTNQLGGLLSGQVLVEQGQSRKGMPWKGRGDAEIRDGVLWGLPLFGLLSPVFDAVAPGMGKAQFNAGNATFTLTNNTVDFQKVELISSAMRLDMKGGVDFDGNLDLLLEARPLRDVPVLGAILDVVLAPFTKLFEYKIGGTLGQPDAELRHVPSFLLAPLRPFRLLKGVFQGPDPKTSPRQP